MKFLQSALIFLVCLSPVGASAASKKKKVEPTSFKGARVEIFKSVGDVKLKIHIFEPANHEAQDRRPAAVFFFGGGWKSGNPGQFEQHCRYLAGRGMVAMTAEYRILSKHGTKAEKCVRDGKSAVRWVRENAGRLGVDPKRIVAGGGSAGGHVAACTGVITGFEDGESPSSVPNAMVLFNPALVLAEVPGQELPFSTEKMAELSGRMGVPSQELSPWHQLKTGVPPTLTLHGKGDTTVVYRTAEAFHQKMLQLGNRSELAGFADQPHGFFNYGRGGNRMFAATMKRADAFLQSLGYLEGPDTITDFLGEK
jgi:acetyl esterase